VQARTVVHGYVLSGRISWVQIPVADAFLVLAHGLPEAGLFKIARTAPGLFVDTAGCPDGTTVAQLSLQNVPVEPSDLLLRGSAAIREIERANLLGLNLCSAELLGLMDGALDMTLNYLRTRVQFGVAIGSLQVLQHRAVDLWIRRQITEAAVMASIARFDDSVTSLPDRTKRALGAKLRSSQSALSLSSQALQLHGAIGFAEEYGLGAYVNRVLTLSAWLGNGSDLRAAYADLRAAQHRSEEAV
jgi:alkylation response protein AidB-like acyl-CoA dehydrogenase